VRILPAVLEGVHFIEATPFVDDRGYFVRSCCNRALKQAGLNAAWAQENLSYTARRGTIRGMHYQMPPAPEIKLVRCVTGAIYDVVLDVRPHSPTFGRWMTAELSETNHRTLYVPEGFAHGFQCLTDDVRLLYHMSVPHDPKLYAGVRWNDPHVGIPWPIPDAMVSAKDAALPTLSEIR
jgi:dTDP-4-dehydrorhamnose 3,5-epimerase